MAPRGQKLRITAQILNRKHFHRGTGPEFEIAGQVDSLTTLDLLICCSGTDGSCNKPVLHHCRHIGLCLLDITFGEDWAAYFLKKFAWVWGFRMRVVPSQEVLQLWVQEIKKYVLLCIKPRDGSTCTRNRSKLWILASSYA